MSAGIKVLYLTQKHDNVEAIRCALQGSPYRCQVHVANNRRRFTTMLEKEAFDVILADHDDAACNGASTLSFVKARCMNRPVIMLAQQVDEECIIESIKQGAFDYVSLSRLSRLPLALQSALREAKKRQRLEAELRESEELHRTVLENITDAVFLTRENGDFTFVCPNSDVIFEYSPEEIHAMGNITTLLGVNSDGHKLFPENGIAENVEQTIHSKHGAERALLITVRRIKLKDSRFLFSCRDITEHKKAEQQLQKSREQLATLVGNLPGLAYRCHNDPDYTIEFISDGCYELTGYTPADFLEGRVRLGEIIHPEDRERVYRQVQEAVSSNGRFKLTYRIIAAHGEETTVWEQGCLSPQSKDGQVLLEGFITDITAQRKALEEIQFQAQMLNSVEQAVIATSLDGTIFYWNDFAEKLYGWKREEALGKNIVGFTTLDAAEVDAAEIMRRLRRGQSWSGEFLVRDRRGRVFPAHVTDTPILDEHGKLRAIIGISHDISEQKKAEQALRESERRFRLAVNHFPDTFVIYDAHRRLSFVNAAGIRMSGHKEAEMLGHRDEDLFPPKVTNPYLPLLKRAVKTRAPQTGECTISLATGSYHLVVTYVPILNENGGIEQILGIMHDISARKKAEQALRESEAKFRALTEATAAAIMIFQGEELLYTNPAASSISGYTADELVGRDFWDIIHQDFKEIVRKRGLGRQQGKRVKNHYETRIVCKNGEDRWIDFTGCKINYQGKPAVLGTAIDITGRKRAEQQMQIRTKQQHTVAELGQLALSDMSFSGLIQEAVTVVARTLNVKYSKILELLPDEDELVLKAGVGWPKRLYGRARVSAQSTSQAGFTLRSQQPVIVDDFAQERRFNRPELLKKHNVVSGISVIIGESDLPYGVLGAHCEHRRSFTMDDANFLQAVANVIAGAYHRQQAEEKLRHSQSMLLRTERLAMIGSWEWDFNTDEVTWSPEMYRQYQLDPEAYPRPTFELALSYIHPDDAKYIRNNMDRAFQTAVLQPLVYKLVCPDGTERYIIGQGELIRNEKGEPVRMTGFAQDITRQKLADEALQASREEMRTLLATMSDYVTKVDRNGVVTFINKSYPSLNPNDVIGASLYDWIEQRYREEYRRKINRVFRTCRQQEMLTSAITPEGRREWYLSRLSPIRQENGINEVIIVSTDITKRKEAAEAIQSQNTRLEQAVNEKQREMEKMMDRLIRQERLVTIGKVSGSIAHELRNPLGAVKQSAFFLRRQLASHSGKVCEHLDLIENELRIADRVITDLLEMTRTRPVQPESIELHAVLARAARRCRLRSEVDLNLDLRPKSLKIWADPVQLQQVFINLFMNSTQAMRGRGAILVRARLVRQKKICRIQIRDDGAGVAPELLVKVFEPLFTTRAKGTGMGLSICRQIIENHNGSIEISNNADAGSTITMLLPAVPK